MNVGITIIVILTVTIFGQMLLQGAQRRREHREILHRLDELKERLGRQPMDAASAGDAAAPGQPVA